MSKFTDGQRKFLFSMGIVILITALIIIGISIGRGGGFPVSAPLLMVISAIFIMIAGKK